MEARRERKTVLLAKIEQLAAHKEAFKQQVQSARDKWQQLVVTNRAMYEENEQLKSQLQQAQQQQQQQQWDPSAALQQMEHHHHQQQQQHEQQPWDPVAAHQQLEQQHSGTWSGPQEREDRAARLYQQQLQGFEGPLKHEQQHQQDGEKWDHQPKEEELLPLCHHHQQHEMLSYAALIADAEATARASSADCSPSASVDPSCLAPAAAVQSAQGSPVTDFSFSTTTSNNNQQQAAGALTMEPPHTLEMTASFDEAEAAGEVSTCSTSSRNLRPEQQEAVIPVKRGAGEEGVGLDPGYLPLLPPPQQQQLEFVMAPGGLLLPEIQTSAAMPVSEGAPSRAAQPQLCQQQQLGCRALSPAALSRHDSAESATEDQLCVLNHLLQHQEQQQQQMDLLQLPHTRYHQSQPHPQQQQQQQQQMDLLHLLHQQQQQEHPQQQHPQMDLLHLLRNHPELLLQGEACASSGSFYEQNQNQQQQEQFLAKQLQQQQQQQKQQQQHVRMDAFILEQQLQQQQMCEVGPSGRCDTYHASVHDQEMQQQQQEQLGWAVQSAWPSSDSANSAGSPLLIAHPSAELTTANFTVNFLDAGEKFTVGDTATRHYDGPLEDGFTARRPCRARKVLCVDSGSSGMQLPREHVLPVLLPSGAGPQLGLGHDEHYGGATLQVGGTGEGWGFQGLEGFGIGEGFSGDMQGIEEVLGETGLLHLPLEECKRMLD